MTTVPFAAGAGTHQPLSVHPVRGAEGDLLEGELERGRREAGVLLVGELEAPGGGDAGEEVRGPSRTRRG